MKNDKKYLIIVVILVLIVLALGSLVVWKMMGKDNTNNEGNNPITDTDINSDLNQKIKKDLDDIIDEELFILNSYKDIDELTNQDKLYLAFYLYVNNSNIDNYEDSFTKDTLESFYKKSSLSGLPITYENLKCYKAGNLEGHTAWIYDDKTNTFNYNTEHGGHGYSEVLDLAHVVSNFEIVNNRYVISLKYIWSELAEGFSETNVFGTYMDGYNNTNILGRVASETDVYEEAKKYLDSNYSSIKDKLDTYVYTFEKFEDSYKLVDFKVNS